MHKQIQKLSQLGQSLWLDDLRRSFTASGQLNQWVETGLRGETSNPSIFDKALGKSTDYDHALARLFERQLSPKAIYENLIIEDITQATKIFRQVYDATQGRDGFVSIEVDPHLAHNTEATLQEARRLFETINQPNLMVKVPATKEGIPAIRELIGEGRNINITLMFSLEQYDAVSEAYLSGLEHFAENGGDLSKVASVASFFVSRMDVLVDPMLIQKGVKNLQGKIGIANAKMAYQRFKKTFSGARWEKLAQQGARPQRVLWASTSVKDPSYPDTMYVDALIGQHTVNTLPLTTIQAFLDHGTVSPSLENDLDQAQAQLKQLADLGIEMKTITAQLLVEGVDKFTRAFDDLMLTIAEKRNHALSDWEKMEANIGDYRHAMKRAFEELAADRILDRIWAKDYTVWDRHPDEIVDRLGWLDIPAKMQAKIPKLLDLQKKVRAYGIKKVLLLGMGGSSLAAELFANLLHNPVRGLPLEVLDTSHPDAIRAARLKHDPEETIFVVSSKSGKTIETLSLFKYFYNETLTAVGNAHAGNHFIAITDPGSPLADLAVKYKFLDTFLNDPNIGGRYSALSYFGLVPAALTGVDLTTLLGRAVQASKTSREPRLPANNPSAVLGLMLGELALSGRDKVTFITPEILSPFTDWVEQLIAESTGKVGKGILPVVREPIRPVESYGKDTLFVYLRLEGDTSLDEFVGFLEEAGQPIITFYLADHYDIGEQLYIWMMAVAIAGWRLGINPFDQPNVESAKAQARKVLQPQQDDVVVMGYPPVLTEDNLSVFTASPAASLGEALQAFLEKRGGGAPMPESEQPYFAIQAYIQPTYDTTIALQWLRSRIIEQTGLTTTVAYGPRFLHATGQLHKGDSGNGLFLQLTDEFEELAIPQEAGLSKSVLGFGELCQAQATGDRNALREAGRKVLLIHLHDQPAKAINRLAQYVQRLALPA